MAFAILILLMFPDLGDGNAITGIAVCTLSDGRWKAIARKDPALTEDIKATVLFLAMLAMYSACRSFIGATLKCQVVEDNGNGLIVRHFGANQQYQAVR
ncbi:MAG: hypothetical protein ETSY2_46795 [Candidatus Entotheonella gemina]|uniref:Uncharacterized protein n=1 Tax=Candidatus Entotheonella gemina TaxID=1429439 RepID=W4LE87_9BACT|nr:MAG: hypothetical protein ETSY2_46795 [Candidatus Entotheonella gemina]